MFNLLDRPIDFTTNVFLVLLNRPLCIHDSQIIHDPKKNPRWFEPGTRTLGDTTDDEFASALFREKSSERLYEILNGHYLLLVDGPVIQKILIERGAWDDARIGTTSDFVPWTPMLRVDVPQTILHSSHLAPGVLPVAHSPELQKVA